MLRRMRTAILSVLAVVCAGPAPVGWARQAPAANPVVVFETVRGAIEFQLFRAEAPKSTAHLEALVKRGFYRGQRFHRVTPVLAQIGDPQSRNMTLRDWWGRSNSGTPINAFELSKKRMHIAGAVGLAHAGNPMAADSQIYFMKQASPSLDGKHAVVGQVTLGQAVLARIQEADVIKNAFLKGVGPK
jgi:cyclophilin family peptidyl-prolyl cis-trans isomerase